jgi:DNA-binding transcriptional LysR family regulator
LDRRAPERTAQFPAVDLRHLRYFLAVYEELHFGHAAERLHIAQPPLSQAIRRLEQELGVQLLERTSRVVAPTEAGKVFADEARKILASFERAIVDARRAGGAGAPLRIGCLPHLSVERLLQFLSGLEQREPELRHQVSHLPSLEQIKRLRNGQLDIGIIHRGEDLPELEFEPLFEGEPGAAFLSRRHRLARQEVLTPADLRRETLVIFPRALNPSVYDLWLAELMGAGYEWESLIEAGGITARDLLIAAAETKAITLGPLSYRDERLMQVLELEARWLDPPVAMADMSLVWPANPPRHLASILTRIRELARELRGTKTSSMTFN